MTSHYNRYGYYTIVYAATAEELIDKVNEYLYKGYDPIGGVSISASRVPGDTEFIHFAQAVAEPATGIEL